jgi:cyclohexyl-isocyanide hydratase
MLTVGVLIFPDVEELDFVGPFEVLSYVNKIRPDSTRVLLVAETLDTVRAYNGMRILPDTALATCPALDILVAPGGKGRLAAMKNSVLIQFIQNQAAQARYTASVCTGAFLLAEAGLLTDKQATTYHECFDELATYNVTVLSKKVVRQDGIITAGGVSSGIELGFYLLRELFGVEIAQKAARKIEYDVDVSAL